MCYRCVSIKLTGSTGIPSERRSGTTELLTFAPAAWMDLDGPDAEWEGSILASLPAVLPQDDSSPSFMRLAGFPCQQNN